CGRCHRHLPDRAGPVRDVRGCARRAWDVCRAAGPARRPVRGHSPVGPVSARLLSTLHGSHTAVLHARLVEPGQTGVDPVGVDIPIRAGDVQLSATADVRSTLDLTTVARWPDRQAPMLAPYGTEIGRAHV